MDKAVALITAGAGFTGVIDKGLDLYAKNQTAKREDLKQARGKLLEKKQERMNEEVKLEKAKQGKVKLKVTGPTNDETEQGEGSWNIKFSGDVDDLHNAMNQGICFRNRNNAITGTNRS